MAGAGAGAGAGAKGSLPLLLSAVISADIKRNCKILLLLLHSSADFLEQKNYYINTFFNT